MRTYLVSEAPVEVRSILVYGETGVGKTRFAATAQFYEPWSPALLAVIGAEQSASVRDYEGLHVVELTTLDDIEWLKNYFLEGQPSGPHPPALTGTWPTFKSLVFDGLTEAQLILMGVKLRRSEKGRTLLTGSLATLPPPAVQRDWGTSFNWCIELARQFTIDFPVPVIFTALERYYKDEQTGDVSVSIGIPGQPSNIVPSKATVTMRLVRSRTFGVRPADWRTLQLLYEKVWGGEEAPPLDNVGLLYSDGKFKAINRLGPRRWIFNPTVERLLTLASIPEDTFEKGVSNES